MKRNIGKTLFVVGIALSSWTPILAQTDTSKMPESATILWLLLAILIVMGVVTLLLSLAVLAMIREKKADVVTEESTETVVETITPSPIWEYIKKRFISDAVPIREEQSIDLGHEYDGIRELDNNLPPWWKYGFYLSIVFAVGYLFVYHFSDTPWSSEIEYQEAIAAAEIQKAEYLKTVGNLVDETSVTLATDAASLENGKEIYTVNCVACHGTAGEGGIGPNFADQYWIHGGTISDLFATIKYGVPEKGMISWQAQLKPKDMQDVASYILSFQGTDPPNAKEPQGELYVPEVAADSVQEVVMNP